MGRMNSFEQDHWPVEADELATGHGGDFEENNFYINNETITENNNDINLIKQSSDEEEEISQQPANKHLYRLWGCPIDQADQMKVTRAYFLNINGVGTNNLSNGFTSLHAHMQQTGSAIGMFAETNVDWKAHSVKESNKQHGRKVYPNAIFAYSSHNEGIGNIFQPGGTMTTINGGLATRHLESGHDPTGMGRYSYQSIMGRNNTKIMFITAY
jgi:hypothetical protein